MSSFKEFLNKVEKSPSKALPALNTSLPTIETTLSSTVGKLLEPTAIPGGKKQAFSDKVSNIVRDEEFISEVSDQIGEPRDSETEDQFVERGISVLRKMLYMRFGLKD